WTKKMGFIISNSTTWLPLLYQVNRALNIQDGFIALAYALNLAFDIHNCYAFGIKNVRKGCSLAVVNTNPHEVVFIKPCNYRDSAIFPKIYNVALKGAYELGLFAVVAQI